MGLKTLSMEFSWLSSYIELNYGTGFEMLRTSDRTYKARYYFLNGTVVSLEFDEVDFKNRTKGSDDWVEFSELLIEAGKSLQNFQAVEGKIALENSKVGKFLWG